MDLNRLIIALDPARILGVLENPQANPQEAAIVAGLLVVSAVILIVLLLLAFGPQAPEPVASRASQDTESSRKRARVIRASMWAIAALIGLGLLGWGFHAAGAPTSCVRCHGPELNASWADSSHASVACFECHAAPGYLGEVAARAAVTGDAGRRLLGLSSRTREAVVANEPCADCHADEISATITAASVRVSHAEFLDVGYACVECHAGVGHFAVVGDRAQPRMERCAPCHDGEQASAECAYCHTADVGVAGQTAMRGYPRSVNLGRPTSCRGCHEIDTCNECHGLELPHSTEFVEHGHAAQAAFGRKEMCAKCHAVAPFCNACHRFDPDGSSAHGDGFLGTHMDKPRDCGCHGKRSREAMCVVCH